MPLPGVLDHCGVRRGHDEIVQLHKKGRMAISHQIERDWVATRALCGSDGHRLLLYPWYVVVGGRCPPYQFIYLKPYILYDPLPRSDCFENCVSPVAAASHADQILKGKEAPRDAATTGKG